MSLHLAVHLGRSGLFQATVSDVSGQTRLNLQLSSADGKLVGVVVVDVTTSRQFVWSPKTEADRTPAMTPVL